MTVIMMYEFNHPKEPDRRIKGYEIAEKTFVPYYVKTQKAGVKWKVEDFTDGTNSVIGMCMFDTLDDFSKIWGDEEFQDIFSCWTYYVDNCKVRILRPLRVDVYKKKL